MPVLGLTDLLPMRPVLAWVRVVGLMFAPDAPRTRALFEEVMRQRPGGLISDAARETAQRDMLTTVRDDGLPKGTLAARILVMTLASSGRTVQQTLEAITQAETRRKGYSYSALRRCWEQFRPVAPLWLAYTLCCDGPPKQPLDAEQLLEVLSVADAYRRRGEAHATGTKATPLIDPATAWAFRLPREAELQPAEVI